MTVKTTRKPAFGRSMLFSPMNEIVPAGESGNVRVVHDRPSKLDILRGAMHGMHLEDRVHTRLIVDGETMMTDAQFEQRTNSEVAVEARGHVFIAGLGIGMILVPILESEEVESVTVCEIDADVIALVKPHFDSEKLTVIHADVFDYAPEKGAKYDTIYFDIWPDICGDNLEQMKSLQKSFRKYLRKGGWMDSWCRRETARQ